MIQKPIIVHKNGKASLLYCFIWSFNLQIFSVLSTILINENSTNIGVFKSDLGKNVSTPISVDSTVDNITLTLAGFKPSIYIEDPNKRPYTKYKVLIETDKAKVSHSH